MSFSRFFVLLLATAMWPTGNALLAQSPELQLAADSIFASLQSAQGPGCSAGVDRHGRALVRASYGMADLEHGVSLTPSSVFHAASVSKQFTAMAAALLASRDVIDLDRPMRAYLPELPPPGGAVTIRQALQHTAGLRDQWELLMAAGWRLGDDLISQQDVLGIVVRQRALNFPPGSEYLYSNTGFTLVAEIIARRSGMPFAAFVSREIFTPLAMRSSRFGDDHTAVVRDRVAGYEDRGSDGWHLRSPHYATVGATGLLTTVDDMLRWGRNFDTGTVGERVLRELTESAVLGNGTRTGYGLGLNVAPFEGRRAFSHAGSDPGFASYFLHLPDEEVSVVVLCNISAAPTASYAHRLARRVLGVPAPRVAAAPWTAEDADARAGWYWNEAHHWSWQITSDSSRLVGSENASQVSIRLRSLGGSRFRVGDGPAEIEFTDPGALVWRNAPQSPGTTYKKHAAWTPSPTARRALVGRYRSEEIGQTYEIVTSGDTLVLRRPRLADLALEAAFRNTFAGAGTIVRFEGRASTMDLVISRPRLRKLRLKRVD